MVAGIGPGAAFGPAEWGVFPFVGGPVGVLWVEFIGTDGGRCIVAISLGRSTLGLGLLVMADVGVGG